MKSKPPIIPEVPVTLDETEIELLLLDVHSHLAQLLAYFSHQNQVLIPHLWLQRRLRIFRNLAAKLEIALAKTQENNDQEETNKKNDHSPEVSQSWLAGNRSGPSPGDAE